MKKFVKYILGLAIVMIMAVACEKPQSDINWHDGADGATGATGNDGKTGAMLLFYVDFARNAKYWYEDNNGNKNWDEGERIHHVEMQNGIKIVPITGGCFNLVQVLGTTETVVGSICSIVGPMGPAGGQGEPGENAHNTVFASRPMIDEKGNVEGQYLDIYWDAQLDQNEVGYGVVDDKDIKKLTVPITNGKTVVPDFKVFSERVTGGVIYTVTINGVIYSNETILDGQIGATGATGATGADGKNPTLKRIYYPNGILYEWYIGDVKLSSDMFPYAIDGTNGTDGKPGDPGAPGKPGEPGTSLACYTETHNFEGLSCKYFQSLGIILDKFIYDEKDGALFLDGVSGSVIFPTSGVYDKLLSVKLTNGSENPYKVTIIVNLKDGSKKVVKVGSLKGEVGFQKDLHDKYYPVEYYCDLNKIEFTNVLNMEVFVERDNWGKCVPKSYHLLQVDIVWGDKK